MKELDLKITFPRDAIKPKYRQLAESILNLIDEGVLKKGDQVPSLSYMIKNFNLSQDTILAAYNDLKSKGIIHSQVGKGYFISGTRSDVQHKVLLLFDTLTAYKEDLYQALKSVLISSSSEQIFFHNNNIKMFQTILEDSAGEYSEFVIMPMDHPSAFKVIEKLPRNKVYILDQGREQYKKLFPFVCQDFERDIYRILKGNENLVTKYHRMILVIPHQKSHFRSIATGFKDFCKQFPVSFVIVNNLDLFRIEPADGFVVVEDRDLVTLVQWCRKNKMKAGKDIGILSYNETPLKGIVGSGISTISTDFTQMGKSMAEMILNNQRQKIDNPFFLINRQSF
jgi:DNA-binding transcriptional regulator YhcF (GntR family)